MPKKGYRRARPEVLEEKINIARRHLNLSNVETKLRKCLKCDQEFKSLAKDNRMCVSCGTYTSGKELENLPIQGMKVR